MKKEKSIVSETIPVNKKGKIKTSKFKIFVIIAVVLAAIIFAVFKSGVLDKFNNTNNSAAGELTTYTVARRSITQSLTSSGTLQPNDSYTITPLVSGEILADFFDEGDIVEEDQLLYKVDSANIESGIKRAQNSLKDAQKNLDNALEDRDNLNVKSEYSGIIENIYVEVGDEVKAGEKIADVVDKDIMCIDIPFMAVEAATFSKGQTATLTFPSYETLNGEIYKIGNTTTVNELGVLTRIVTIKVNNSGGITPSTTAYASVGNFSCTAPSSFYYNDEGSVLSEISGEVIEIVCNEGDKVDKNGVIVVLESEELEDRIEQLERSVEDAESSLEDTLDNYDNYNITSPISGTVISKEYKAGDTLGSGGGNAGSASMAVIYDMSAFKFTMNIDELDIDKIKNNQEVIVTTDARKGKQYIGNVTNISIQGSTSNGTTIYPVTVTIENTEDESKRTTDPDGTVHKYYKTGKTGTVNSYTLSSKKNNVYTYSDDIVIIKTADEEGNVSFFRDGKQLMIKKDGSYAYGADIYNISSDMQTLTVETVDETAMLRPGMNIDAEILVQNVQNVIAVPVSAIMRGYTVKVISRAADTHDDTNSTETEQKHESDSRDNGKRPQFDKNSIPEYNRENMPEFDIKDVPEFDMENVPEFNPENMPDFGGRNGSGFVGASGNGRGTASSDTEYEEVKVEVGVTDNNYIEIKSGLNVGDVIILDEINAMNFSGNGNNSMQGFGGMGGGMGGFGGAPMMGGGSGMMRPGGR